MASTSRERKRRRGMWYLVLTAVAGLALVATLIAVKPIGGPLSWVIRGAALLGYVAVFLTTITSAYMREVFQLLGRPFIRAHHILSVTALILMTLHPLGVVVRSSDVLDLLPDFSSVYQFFSLGGRPAWYFFAIAAVAAVLRRRIKNRWRLIHFLNYVGFLLASVHAILIGTDFVSLVMKGIAVAMALVVVGIFVAKRVQRWRLKRRT